MNLPVDWLGLLVAGSLALAVFFALVWRQKSLRKYNRAAAEVSSLTAELASLTAEKARLDAERAAIRSERDALKV
jgi:ABC-type transport system involved in cytochrome c biogenesis permease subunit